MSLPSSNVATLHTGGKLAPINPQSYEDVVRLAKMAVLSGLSCKGKTDEEDVALAKATMAILHGLECGIPAIQAVQGIAIINGKPMMYGDLLTALLWSKGFKIKKWIEGTGDGMVGHARITRPDGDVVEKSFSVTQAKRANLWDARETVKRKWDNTWKDVANDSPWFCYPERMLEWRAFGFCVKDGASDATHGMLVREESDPDFNRMVDVTPTSTDIAAPDIPDDAPEPETETKVVPAADVKTADDPFPVFDAPRDPDAFLETLEAAISGCHDPEGLQEVYDANVDIIAGLPEKHRAAAKTLFEEAGP